MLKGKIILKGKIKLESPLKIGSNTNDITDTDILKDSEGNPFIPATSFIGVLRHYTKNISEYDVKTVWGNAKDNKEYIKNRIYCSDLNLIQPKSNIVEVRDGIRIDNKTGLVKDGAKYNFEVTKKGLEFSFNLEFDVQEIENDKRFISTIISELEQGKIKLGSKTNSGFGKVILTDKEIYIFDFNNKVDLYNWISYLKGDYKTTSNINSEPFIIKNNTFSIQVTFSLRNSILIKSYSADPEMPDSTHLKSDGEHIISGTSLKGAIRSRAEKIANTLGKNNIINDLFGDVDNENKMKRAIKGKVTVNEVVLAKFISQMQTRIKINRFTGGTIDGALFETMPVFTDFKEKVKDVEITIHNFENYHAGLLLLVLKDLWTGDIAIGGDKGVGRGTLEGEMAIITWNDNQIFIPKDVSKLSENDKKSLEFFVEQFIKKEVA